MRSNNGKGLHDKGLHRVASTKRCYTLNDMAGTTEIFNLRNQKEKQLFIHWVMEEDHVMVGNFPAVTLGSPRVNSFKLPGMRVALSDMARIPYLYTQRRC